MTTMGQGLAGPQWYVVTVLGGAEPGVARRLVERGVAVFSPLVRFQIGARGGKRWVSRALFPGYLLVRIGLKHVGVVLGTPGVFGLIGSRGEGAIDALPVSVPVSTVDKLMALSPMDADALRHWMGIEKAKHTEPSFVSGDAVRIIEGPFAGMDGIVVSVDRRGELGLDVPVFGHTTKIVIDRNHVATGRTARPCNAAPLNRRAS